jgi:hypothetical protein
MVVIGSHLASPEPNGQLFSADDYKNLTLDTLRLVTRQTIFPLPYAIPSL